MKLVPAFICLAAGLVLVTGCTDGAGAIRDSERAASEAADRKPAIPSPADSGMEAVEGVVVYEGNEKKLAASSGLITIYGKNGEPLKVINREDESLESLTGGEGDFYPFYFSNGASHDFGIELRAVRRSKDWIEVVIHETREPKTLGYVRAEDPLFKYLSWPDWVKGQKNIRFDTKENPVRESPNGRKKKVAMPEEPWIKAEGVRGDWAKIVWTKPENGEPSAAEIADKYPQNFGWIMWRKDGKVLIGEHYP